MGSGELVVGMFADRVGGGGGGVGWLVLVGDFKISVGKGGFFRGLVSSGGGIEGPKVGVAVGVVGMGGGGGGVGWW